MSGPGTPKYKCLGGTLLCQTTFGGEKNQKPFLHLSLSKAGPFTLESHICVKAFICLINPVFTHSTQTIFQGDTS